jgi:excisionase family DNA binding protein
MRREQLYSPDEVAEILGVSASTLARWRRTGDPDLPFLRLGGGIRYRASDIEAFLEEIDDHDGESEGEAEEGDDST